MTPRQKPNTMQEQIDEIYDSLVGSVTPGSSPGLIRRVEVLESAGALIRHMAVAVFTSVATTITALLLTHTIGGK